MRRGTASLIYKAEPPASSAPFAPTSIAGLVLWLDASDASTVTLDGSNNVSQWNDKSGNARHATQATVLTRPNYVTAAQNGLNAIRTTAAGALHIQTAQFSAETFFGTNRNDCTHFLVWKFTSGTIAQRTWIGNDTNRIDWIGSASRTLTWNGSNYSPTAFGASTSWRCLTSRFDGPNSKHDSWNSSTKVATQTNFTGFAMASASTYRVRFGNDAVAADADFGEAIYYNRPLTDAEVTQVIDYLRAKWGL